MPKPIKFAIEHAGTPQAQAYNYDTCESVRFSALVAQANLVPELVGALQRICADASECKMHGDDEPSQVDGIDWADIEVARALLSRIEGGAE